MQLKYTLNQRPPLGQTLLYGLQWLVLAIPNVVTISILAHLQFGDDWAMQTLYLQKVYFILGLTMLAQTFIGHRMPLVVGPAAVLIVGILSAGTADFNAIYTSIAIGGAVLLAIAACGLLDRVARVFTPRVVITILGLIAMTLAPVIISSAFSSGNPAFDYAFFFTAVVATFVLERFLRGVGKSLTVVILVAVGTAIYFAFNDVPTAPTISDGVRASDLVIAPRFDAPLAVSFIACFFALLVNDLGSIESLRTFIGYNDKGATRRGVTVTAAGNIVAGLTGVIGPVNYSVSPGIVSSTRCAARITAVPCALGLMLCAFFPGAVVWLTQLPSTIVGLVLAYVVILQFAAGFQMMVTQRAITTFNHALTIAIPLAVALTVSFLPSDVTDALPSALRPILSNGFVIGVLLVVFLEHLVFFQKKIKQ